MRMFVAGNWLEKAQKIEVLNPFDTSDIDTVPRATVDDVEQALVSAVDTGSRSPFQRPYGGLKESGLGKEGPKYAVQEMSELKMVVWHLN